MKTLSGRQAEAYVKKLEQRGPADLARVEKPVRRIVDDVRKNGDRALRRYAEKLDGLAPRSPFLIPTAELKRAWKSVPAEFRAALQMAASNIRRYCEWQKPQEWRRTSLPGISLGQVLRPLDSVGCYVPGGRYPLPSTMLMTVIPAQVAGVQRICVTSPKPVQQTLATAFFLGVRELYAVGGAQAIAALAYGTKSVRKVDKIVGPGNLYVTAAKKMVAFDCSIDFLAGPTEAALVSHGGEPRFIAADLVAQSEHAPDTLAVFITTSAPLAEAVAAEASRAAARNPIARTALQKHGAILLARSRAEAMDFANRIACEHITVPEEDVPLVRHAGSIFVGDYSAQAAGDYASGPNHVLPTGGVARYRGGLNVTDFLKTISLQQLSRQGIGQIGAAITCLAEAEGLEGHAESIRVRSA